MVLLAEQLLLVTFSLDLDVYVTNDQDDGVTALHDAVMANHLEAVKLLLQQGGKTGNVFD